MTEARKAAQSARSLTAAEDLVRTVMASASIGIALADLDGSFRVVNRSLRDLVGYDEAWFLAHQIQDVIHPDDVEEVRRRRYRVLAGSSDTMKLRLVRADGATVWVRWVSVLIRDGDGQPNLLMVQLGDITTEHEAQEALIYQAFHDPLTGLHNRAWILDILKVDLRAAKRLGHSVGALCVDLAKFQVVNESLGHAAGDKVLATGRTGSWRACVRGIASDASVGTSSSSLSRTSRTSWTSNAAPNGCPPRSPPACRCEATGSCRPPPSVSPCRPRPRPRQLTACCATQTPRCPAPRPPVGRAGTSSTTRCTPRLWPASPLRSSCVTRSPGASSWCTTSRSSPCPTPTWWDTRHSCAGCTPPETCSASGSSSTSPRTPGSSPPSAPRSWTGSAPCSPNIRTCPVRSASTSRLSSWLRPTGSTASGTLSRPTGSTPPGS